MKPAIIAAILLPTLTAFLHAPQQDPVGCYIATPPLGISKAVAAVLDTQRAVISIESGGGVRRPRLTTGEDQHGTWNVTRDTLRAYFHNGFSGWNYTLVATPTGWKGVAQFSSDEVYDRDHPNSPRSHPAIWIRHSCR